MNKIIEQSDRIAARAAAVLAESGIKEVWERHGATVNLIGSVAMGLIINHQDIDLHVYSSGITEESSFAIVAEISKNPQVTEITCINGLHTDEHCMAWHLQYKADNGEIWKFDIIHIEKGTKYDGFFESMAEKINAKLTNETKEAILRLKSMTPETEKISGVEYYEAVIEHGITDYDVFMQWVAERRKNPRKDYWLPKL